MFLTKEQILQVDDLETEEVKVWGGKVLVRGLTATERNDFVKEQGTDETKVIPNLIPRLVALTVIDPKTKLQLFTKEDIEALGKKSAQSLDKLFLVAQKLSGLDVEGVKEIEKK